jgi:hypothetical protein
MFLPSQIAALSPKNEKSSDKKMGRIKLLPLDTENAVSGFLRGQSSLFGSLLCMGYGQKPLMILTTKNNAAWEIVEAYLTRWRIEETIRFAKQAFDMENIRLLTYKRLQNMYALLMGALAFNMTVLSLKTKLKVLYMRAIQATKTLFGVPDFHYYTLASGIALVFKRAPKPHPKPPKHSQFFQPQLL